MASDISGLLIRDAVEADVPALVSIFASDAKGGHGDTTDPQAKPDYVALAAADGEKSATGTCLFAAYDSGSADIEVRSFAPACGVNEDPVCGSGNGSVAAFMRFHRMPLIQRTSLLSSQGQKLGRAGRVHLDITPDAVKVGGAAVTCIDGHLTV